MSYIDPKVRKQFDTLSPELQKAIMDKNIPINSLQDLIRVLDNIANGG
jgi:hypothetical protein